MRPFQQRALVTLAATAMLAVCGTLAGYFLGRELTLRHAQSKLDLYASRIRSEGETSAGEARSVLATINASPYPYCSDDEVAWIRKLIFQSEYLKEAGRMKDGRIDCSATLGRIEQPSTQFKPDFSRPDGTKVYRNLPSLRIGDQTIIGIQLGDSYIVYSPYNLNDLESAYMHFTVSAIDAPSGLTGRLVGEQSKAQTAILTREGGFRDSGSLFFTRCSVRYVSCMTAYISIPEALRINRGEFTAYIVLGGLTGASFGFICSLLYRRNRSIAQQLRRAIRRDKLRLVYQPIVDLASGRIVAAEALARWNDEDGGVVGPDLFIRIAEERGYVGEITKLSLRHALRDFREMLRGNPAFLLSINVSALDLVDPGFLAALEQALARESIPAQSLVIEITERSTANHEAAIKTILCLRQLGHPVHIDDFGTGYSSLSYLHDLAVDAIKIDKSFTHAIGTEAVTQGILPQILAMAQALNLQVIVEGIETQEQADYFAGKAQSILAQGWLFGRPVPAEEFLRLLAGDGTNAAGSAASHLSPPA
jgi:sensor c-di-GMP phosphodiesterase-like protein